MKIKYKVNGNGESLTPCPNQPEIIENDFRKSPMVGSQSCWECKSFGSLFPIGKEIECKYEETKAEKFAFGASFNATDARAILNETIANQTFRYDSELIKILDLIAEYAKIGSNSCSIINFEPKELEGDLKYDLISLNFCEYISELERRGFKVSCSVYSDSAYVINW